MSATTPVRIREGFPKELPDLFESRFVQIASVVSTLVLLTLSTLYTFLGAIAGYVLQQHLNPELKLGEDDRILTIFNASLLVVGAFAAVIGLTPAAALGGFIFTKLPFICSSAIGDTAYRFVSAFDLEAQGERS